MKLFHYHYWTDRVQDVETFYKQKGFEVFLRLAKEDGEFKKLDVNESWSELNKRNLLFRIIEVRKGKVNYTFGSGKKPIFDHIGFLVSDEEYQQVLQRANENSWKIEEGERRTFLSNGFGFEIELQKRQDVIADEEFEIKKMTIMVKHFEKMKEIEKIMGKIKEIEWIAGDHTKILKIKFSSNDEFQIIDPTTIELIF